MKTGNNIRKRTDGRYEARYIKDHDNNGHIIYGYCYGKTYEEAEEKRFNITSSSFKELNLIIMGAGSHGIEVYELAKSLRLFKNLYFLDDNKTSDSIKGKWNDYTKFDNRNHLIIPAVGNNTLRKTWMIELNRSGFIIPTLIHPNSTVSQTANIGIGTVVCAGAVVGNNSKIGNGCIIDDGAIIERDTIVNDWTWVNCGEIWKLKGDSYEKNN